MANAKVWLNGKYVGEWPYGYTSFEMDLTPYLINFSIEGPGKIVAVDNGDATSHDPFQASYRKAYNGMALVIVKAEKGATTPFTVKAESKGLKGASILINTKK